MKKIYISALMLITLTTQLSATESRTWTAKDGKKVEAEFVCMSMGRVVLKNAQGKELKPELKSLSEKDQLYLQSIIPPEIDIAFSKKQDRRTGSRNLSMRGKVKLTKKNKMPYDGTLHVVFYMFGENDYLHEYVILDRVESEFNFKESDSHLITGNVFRMYDRQSSNRGVEYKGYWVAVLNEDKQIVALESNRKQFARQINDFIKLEVGEQFSSHVESRSGTKYHYDWHPCCHGHPFYW